MPQSVIGNHRQFVGFVLVGVVVAQKILQGTVGRVVAHHGAVVLGEYPVAPLPISPDFLKEINDTLKKNASGVPKVRWDAQSVLPVKSARGPDERA